MLILARITFGPRTSSKSESCPTVIQRRDLLPPRVVWLKYRDNALRSGNLLHPHFAMTVKKLILVLGATGAQGLAVIDALLAPAKDGSPSPYAVRALTRDTNSKRAKDLASKGVEVVEGIVHSFGQGNEC